MKPHQIQSNKKGLFLLVDGKEIYPMEESLFQVTDYVLVTIEGGEAILTDPSNQKYHEVWEVFRATPMHVEHTLASPFKLKDLVENDLYFITITITICTLGFYIGLLIGWLMLKIG